MKKDQERIQWHRTRWSSSGNLTESEVEEMIDLNTDSAPMTVKKQVRKYTLEVKDCNPNRAAELEQTILPLLSMQETFSTENDIHTLSVILSKYISGFVLYPDDTQEVTEEKSKTFPLPLKTLTAQVPWPYQVWWQGSSITAYWKAWRQGRPTVLGYGTTEQEAIETLRYLVQPDMDGTLDGFGKSNGPSIGGNVFDARAVIDHNRGRFATESPVH